MMTGCRRRKWQLPTLPPGGAVPSAMVSLTSLFGMEEVDPHRYNRHSICLEKRYQDRTIYANLCHVTQSLDLCLNIHS